MPNVTDQLVDDLVHRQTALLRTAEGMSASLVDQFETIQGQILSLLKRSDLSRYTRVRTNGLLSQINKLLTQFAQKALKINAEGAARVANLMQSRTATDINDVFRVELANPVVTIDQMKVLMNDTDVLGGRTMEDFWNQWPTSTTNAYADVIRTGAVYGQTPGDMIAALADSVALDMSSNQISTAVRTSVINTANQARLNMYQDMSDVAKGVQWVATLDSRTCEQCGALDGLMWDLDFAPIDHDIPFPGAVAHPNCRCTQVPVTKSWDELSDSQQGEFDDIEDTTRASMDGQVSADLNYEDWLGSKSEAFQRDVLGPTRFDLWSRDQISMRDLLSQTGNTLTVDELEQRFG